jgi:hypothetical protein
MTSNSFSLFSLKKPKSQQQQQQPPKKEQSVVEVTAPKNDDTTTMNNNNNNRNTSMAAVEDIDFYFMELELGEGAMRFAPTPGEQPTFAQQVSALSTSQRQVYHSLKTRWDDSRHQRKNKIYNPTLDDIPDYMFLRFARFSVSSKDIDRGEEFREDRAWKALIKYDHRYIHMTARNMEAQLLTKVCVLLLEGDGGPLVATINGGDGEISSETILKKNSNMPSSSISHHHAIYPCTISPHRLCSPYLV